MRVPKQSAVSTWTALIALAEGLLSVACAQDTIRVSWDEREDLSRYRTWDWIDGNAVFVRAQVGNDAEVKAQLTTLLERELRGRGLEHAPGAGEVRVAALMVGTRTVQTLRRGRAAQTLHSFHDVGGFEVQSEVLERRELDRCRVAIYLTGPRQERMIWQGVADQR